MHRGENRATKFIKLLTNSPINLSRRPQVEHSERPRSNDFQLFPIFFAGLSVPLGAVHVNYILELCDRDL